jgi:hypothetical protein
VTHLCTAGTRNSSLTRTSCRHVRISDASWRGGH